MDSKMTTPYVTKPGDTVETIWQSTGVEPARLLAYNTWLPANQKQILPVGQTVVIPHADAPNYMNRPVDTVDTPVTRAYAGNSPTYVGPSMDKVQLVQAQPTTYVTKSGDTVETIARTNSVEIARLMLHNPTLPANTNQVLVPGYTVIVPVPDTPESRHAALVDTFTPEFLAEVVALVERNRRH